MVSWLYLGRTLYWQCKVYPTISINYVCYISLGLTSIDLFINKGRNKEDRIFVFIFYNSLVIGLMPYHSLPYVLVL